MEDYGDIKPILRDILARLDRLEGNEPGEVDFTTRVNWAIDGIKTRLGDFDRRLSLVEHGYKNVGIVLRRHEQELTVPMESPEDDRTA